MLNPILIIDDDLDYIQSLNYELHEENIILDSCQNGVDGIEYLKNHPDLELIILDLNLLDCEPVPENIDPVLLINMLYRIKPTIKIIVNTEKSPLLSRKKAEDLNISLYLEKSENMVEEVKQITVKTDNYEKLFKDVKAIVYSFSCGLPYC